MAGLTGETEISGLLRGGSNPGGLALRRFGGVLGVGTPCLKLQTFRLDLGQKPEAAGTEAREFRAGGLLESVHISFCIPRRCDLPERFLNFAKIECPVVS